GATKKTGKGPIFRCIYLCPKSRSKCARSSEGERIKNSVRRRTILSRSAGPAGRAGLPTGAVIAQIVKKPHLVGALNNYQDTLAGGLELGFTNGGGFSLGFLFQRWGTARYMMTAGHCTPVMGSVDTSFWAAQEYNF